MRPRDLKEEGRQGEMFQARLDQILNLKHPLVELGGAIEWGVFEREMGALYVDKMGCPGLPIRLLVGLHYLKYVYDVSDEGVVEGFLENPYWQYFCGYEYFQHEFPCDPTSLVKWRKRVGPEGMEKLLKETIATAQRKEILKPRELERVNVDTTVQEKAVAFPTDARLYHKMRRVLVREAKARGIELRQSYERVGKYAFQKQSRYAAAQQGKRAKRQTRQLRTYLGRVLRDVRRKCSDPDELLTVLLERAEKLYAQKRDDKNKLYSAHAPEVECIAKGKAHKRYEFGCKVSVVATSKQGWVVGIDAVHGNPYDGHTLKAAMDQMQKVAGARAKEIFVDRGYKGSEHHPQGAAVYLSGRKGLKGVLKACLRRRSAIEPAIGHLKSDHRMERNPLLGKNGDRIHAMLAGCGFNLRKLLRVFLSFFGIDFENAKNRISTECCTVFRQTLAQI